MKKMLILILASLLFISFTALAGEQTKAKETKKDSATTADKAKNTQSAAAEERGGVLLTGSYIKQNVKRNGRITDGASQVIVLDRKTIEGSGASDVRQLLNRQGIH